MNRTRHEPIIEYKGRRPSGIKQLSQECQQHTEKARALLKQLEKALWNCGLQADGIYNSAQAGITTRPQSAVIIEWKNGEIALAIPPKGGRKAGERFRHPDFWKVEHLTTRQLLVVARHLPFFVDHLEGNLRNLLDEVQQAVGTLGKMIEKVQNPQTQGGARDPS